MSLAQKVHDRMDDDGAVRIRLASAQDIKQWSSGEVKKPETINYRTYRPEKDGLFCERIFGPERDWECSCGKYRGLRYKGQVCERCGVQVAHSRVRRKRMGHIELAAPVVHIWFFKAMPSRLGALLGMKTTELEKVIYFQEHVVIDPGQTPLHRGCLLTDAAYREAREKYGQSFEAGMGAEAIKKMLERLDLGQLSRELHAQLAALAAREKPSRQRPRPQGARSKRNELTRRLKVVEALRDSGNRPEWMVLDCIPVIPPDLRPLILVQSGQFACSDLNDLYRRIINRSNRLKKLMDLHSPEMIIRNEKRLLQQAVDALFDNEKARQPVLGSSNRPLKSLSDMLKGKQGRFRENLLGKRVDYSARSVIVVGPELKLHQCGLPKKIALELFQPFIIRRLMEREWAESIRTARIMIDRAVAGSGDRAATRVWDALEDVIQGHPVLLNRAPTLHRMGIQAFEPVLIEGNAIRLHPLVCKGFNADFDGDQMAVHLPLSVEAQVEATVLMMSTNNIFSPANGQPIISPSQDIVMGCYYMTADLQQTSEVSEEVGSLRGDGMMFSSPAEVVLAHEERKVGIHARIRVRLPMARRVFTEGRSDKGAVQVVEAGRRANGLVSTTVGRVLFNDILHPQMAFYDLAMSAKNLSRIIADCYQALGRRETVALLDRMKELGFREATRSGLSFATDDLRTPANKGQVLQTTEKEVEKVKRLYLHGHLTEGERYRQVIELWTAARDAITNQMMHELAHDVRDGRPYLNPIYLMAHSGARGGIEQVRQLGGMRGLMAKPSGEIIETPIKASFRDGLSVLEYFSSTHGARKGLADTALKTAEAGYLTRKLADVAQNVVVRMRDCGSTRGFLKTAIVRGEVVERSLAEAIRGRVSRDRITTPDGQVIVGVNEVITSEAARRIEQAGIPEVVVRSPLTCEAERGVCQLCYGTDLSTGALVEEGMAVGIIAAQSIGEPGTQLTMRNFHIGGVHSSQDITLGLPRVIELFEAQEPRHAAALAEVAGLVRVIDWETVAIQPLDDQGRPTGAEHRQRGLAGRKLFVQAGDRVEAGDRLTEGVPSPQEVLRTKGLEALQQYLVQEVQTVYLSQHVMINDKHVELIMAQMLRRVKVESAGDTHLLPGTLMDKFAFRQVNRRLRECIKIKDAGASRFMAGAVIGKEAYEEERARLAAEDGLPPTFAAPTPARCSPVLLGVAKAAVQSDSFISAASFQETTKVLTEAALAGKVDPLAGLKENVILGRLVPAGTGFRAQGS